MTMRRAQPGRERAAGEELSMAQLYDPTFDPERWTTAPVPVDEKWLERFTRGLRLRGTGTRSDREFIGEVTGRLAPQPPVRIAA